MSDFKDCILGKDKTDKFPGIDGVTPDAAGINSAWFFGIEPGFSLKNMRDYDQGKSKSKDEEYSVEAQLNIPFNRGVFKLIGSIENHPIRHNQYKKYALQNRFFEVGSTGYVKANIYPVAANSVGAWGGREEQETGFASKKEYYQFCDEYRFPIILNWMKKYQPRYVVALGVTQRNKYAKAILGKEVEFKSEKFEINGHTKIIYYYLDGSFPLFIFPHLTGGRHGLNSFDAIEFAARRLNILTR